MTRENNKEVIWLGFNYKSGRYVTCFQEKPDEMYFMLYSIKEYYPLSQYEALKASHKELVELIQTTKKAFENLKECCFDLDCVGYCGKTTPMDFIDDSIEKLHEALEAVEHE